MHYLSRSALAAPLLMLATAAPPASAAVTIEGTRIVVDGSLHRDTTVRISNDGSAPAMTQAWIDTGDSSAAPERLKVPFRITPAGPRVIQPSASHMFRITYAPRPSEALPTDRESVLYFNLLDIPPEQEDTTEQNLLRFAVRSRIKLFYRPPGLPGTAAAAAGSLRWQIQNEGGTRWLTATNPGPFHVTVTKISVNDTTELAASMIPPHGQHRTALPPGSAASDRVSFSWLDDYGALRDQQSPVQVQRVSAEDSR